MCFSEPNVLSNAATFHTSLSGDGITFPSSDINDSVIFSVMISVFIFITLTSTKSELDFIEKLIDNVSTDTKNEKFTVYLTKQSEQLDEVVLSVFKGDAKTNRVAERVAVITAKEIEKLSPQTSADLLAAIPGIKVQKSQMGGGSPVIRGMESNRVLLVIDGVRMNNAIYRKGHLQNAITVAPNQLDKTEIVFGPSSVIYGSDALGGVIHYYTKTPKIAENTKVTTSFFNRYSSINNEITNNASVEIGTKKWASFTSVSYSDFGDLKMGKNRSHGFNDWGKVFEFSENSTNFFRFLVFFFKPWKVNLKVNIFKKNF